MAERIRRWAACVAATLVLTSATVVVTDSAALAVSCSSSGTGIWEVVRSFTRTLESGRTVQLALRNERVRDHSAAMLTGAIASSDELWVERLNGGTWEACPRTTVGTTGGSVRLSAYSAANLGFTMRACMAYTVYGPYRQTLCTSSYTDTD